MDKEKYILMAEALKAIAHPVRLRVIEVLKGKELSVTDIQYALSIKQSITSQHLNSMKSRGVLSSRKVGNVVYYSILNKNILKIITCIKSCRNIK